MYNTRNAISTTICSAMEQKPFQKWESLKSLKNKINFGLKKLLLVFFTLLGLNMFAFSQDIIITKDSQKINAKIIEINIDNIKYKKFNNLEGPIYTLLKSDIVTIIYQNGMIDVFEGKEKKSVAEKDAGVEEEIFTVLETGDSQDKMKSEFYAIGTNDEKMLSYLKENDISSYEKFAAACNQRRKGKTLLGTGIGLAAFGSVMLIMGAVNSANEVYDPYYDYSSTNNNTHANLAVFGLISAIAGEALIIASIPVSAVAGAKKKSIKNEFEQKYFSSKKYSYQPALNLGFTQGGLGLTLKF
jgi:hypothetical protein